MRNISGDARKLIKDPFLPLPAAKKEEKTEASADAAHEKLAFQEHISLFPSFPVSSSAAEASSECIKRSRKKVGERRDGVPTILPSLLHFPSPSPPADTSRETREEEEGRVKISPSYRKAADSLSPGFGFVFGLFYPIRRLRVLYLLSPSPHPRAASLRKSRKPSSSSSSPSSQEEEATTDCPSPSFSSSSHYFYLSPPTTVGGSEAAKAVDVSSSSSSSSSSSVSCAHFAPHGASASLWTGTKAASAPQREVGG